jgi:ribulose-phosphate 3-epimerase
LVGNFVPHISWGAPVIAKLRKHTEAFFDCHMMVANPSQWVDDIAKAGGDQYTFHLEAALTEKATAGATNTDHATVSALCRLIRESGMKVGVAIKPGTSVEAVSQYVTLVDMVLVMTVEPGFGGQSFMPNMMPKVLHLRKAFPLLDIEVDGGLGLTTIEAAAAAGANMIVAGSSVFKAKDKAAVILAMRRIVEEFGNGLPEDKRTPLPMRRRWHLLAAVAALTAVLMTPRL